MKYIDECVLIDVCAGKPQGVTLEDLSSRLWNFAPGPLSTLLGWPAPLHKSLLRLQKAGLLVNHDGLWKPATQGLDLARARHDQALARLAGGF